MKNKYKSNQIRYYFAREKKALLWISITGVIYNVGLAARPYFEGQLVGRLNDILGGKAGADTMLELALMYGLVMVIVQICRYYKRLGVRQFANRIAKEMKLIIYQNIMRQLKPGEDNSKIGEVMTKAIADANAAAEGMRKFTTEIYDTGIVLVVYIIILLRYDWRLTLICMIFMPLAYFIAEKMKSVVTKHTAIYKEAMGNLNNNTLERLENALTYRVYGLEKVRSGEYHDVLNDYEHKAIMANIWENSMSPLYTLITLLGSGFIVYFGARNVLGLGWAKWDIAAFTTFLACFEHLAAKAGKSAKLFNNVQKARVSWNRIHDYLAEVETYEEAPLLEQGSLNFKNVGFGFEAPLLNDFNLELKPGEVLGVSGDIASGKTSFGKMLLGEVEHQGIISYADNDLEALLEDRAPLYGYVGHKVELFNDTIENNIKQGVEGDVSKVLQIVCLDEDLKGFPDGIKTLVGDGGVRLSGGQQARLALARTLYHERPILILDDPFSAVDQKTEQQIYANLREVASDKIIILLSHRLVLFAKFDHVLWLNGDKSVLGTHEEVLKSVNKYQEYYEAQVKGGIDRA